MDHTYTEICENAYVIYVNHVIKIVHNSYRPIIFSVVLLFKTLFDSILHFVRARKYQILLPEVIYINCCT